MHLKLNIQVKKLLRFENKNLNKIFFSIYKKIL